MTGIQRVLVIGGGIAGPVTALALRKAGIDATVYEAYADSGEGVGGVLTVAPNGLAALDVVGAGKAVAAVGTPMPKMVMGDGSGKKFGEFAGIPGLPPSRTVWRADLHRVLHDHALNEGVEFEYGKRLTGVSESAEGITARFADGSTASGDVLVGADGIRSVVRTLIDKDAPVPEYVGLLGFGGIAPKSGLPVVTDTMYFAFGKRAFLGYWTQSDGSTLWFSNLPHPEPLTAAQVREIPAADWLRTLREAHAGDVPAEDLLRRSGEDELFVGGPLEIMPEVPHWHRGRMVLVGDSAHAPSASSGQGASLAAESGVHLARCLRDLPDHTAAFEAYERLRRPRVAKIAARAAKVNNDKAGGPIAKALMGLLMPIALKTVMKPEKMFGVEHRYRIDWADRVTG